MAIKDPEQFLGEQSCNKRETTIPSGDTPSSVSENPSEESQTSAHNKKIMVETKISANASQGGAEEQFFGGNCGKGNATPNAEGTGSAEVNNIKQFNMKNRISVESITGKSACENGLLVKKRVVLMTK